MNIDCARLVVKVVDFQRPIQLYKQLWKGHDFSMKNSILLFNTNIKWASNLIQIPKLKNCDTHLKKYKIKVKCARLVACLR